MRIIVLLLVFTAFAGAQTKKFATDSLKVNGGLIVKGVDVTDFVVTQPSGGGSGFDHEILDQTIAITVDSVSFTIASQGYTNVPDVVIVPTNGWGAYVANVTSTLITVKPFPSGIGERYNFDLFISSND